MSVQGKLIEYDLAILDGIPPIQTSIQPLPDALRDLTASEETFHLSLCRHSEFFPLLVDKHQGNWLSWVVTKYKLPNGEITDFAYISTTSVSNTIVLVEIEDPKKKMWVGPAYQPSKDGQFSDALEQVERWRSALNDPLHLQQLIADMSALMGQSGMKSNRWNVDYVLIYGRSAENNTDQRRKAYADLQQHSGIHLATFDNLVTAKENGRTRVHNIVKMATGRRLSYAFLNQEPLNDFGIMAVGNFDVDPEVVRLLESKKYNMDAWKAGELLTVNSRYPRSSLQTIVAAALSTKPP